MNVPAPRLLPPWTPRDRATISVTNTVAAGVLLAGAVTLGADSSTSTAITWLNLSVIAVVAAAAADLWWIAAGRRALLDRRRTICSDLRPADAGDVRGVTHGAAWVHVEGMTRAHRADCVLVSGKETQPVDPTTRHSLPPLRRCEVCAP